MCDESTDSSNTEQVVFCIIWTNDELEPHKEFIRLYKVDNIYTNTSYESLPFQLSRPIRQNIFRVSKLGTVLGMSDSFGECYISD